MPGRVKFKGKKEGFWSGLLLRFRTLVLKLNTWRRGSGPVARSNVRSNITRAKVILRDETTHCLACGLKLAATVATVRCSANPMHVVHRECSIQLVRGKCPLDGNPLAAS